MQRAAWVAVVVVALTGVGAPAQVVRYIDGIFVAPRKGAPIELIAYAEQTSVGRLRMAEGSLEDAPLIHEAVSVLTSLPHWKPIGAFVTTTELFKDERAERRNMSFAMSKLNVYALGLRIADLESRERIDEILRAVRASYDNPGFAFIVMSSDGYIRYYPMRLTPLEQ
jgi:hypothetical protein